jgi:tRNA pseudouridine(38-40) synthase
MDIMSVTKNFNAKMSCDQRTYEYLAPTFIFQKREKKKKIVEGEAKWPTDLDDVDKEEIVVDDATLKAHMSYRMSDETWTYLNQVLKEYVGTHNFHNFTSKLEPKDPKCNRYITSFIAEKPFVENDMEWVRLRVIGQSFLLHHIRKMIGTAVEIIAGVTDLDTINRGTQLEKMDLPKAPSVGLYLAKVSLNENLIIIKMYSAVHSNKFIRLILKFTMSNWKMPLTLLILLLT